MPSLGTLEEEIATAFAHADRGVEQNVIDAIPKGNRIRLLSAIEQMIERVAVRRGGPDLQRLKAPPGAPSQYNLNRLLDNIAFMAELEIGEIDLSHLPAARRQEFVKVAFGSHPTRRCFCC